MHTKVILATTTSYRSTADIRYQLALKTVRLARLHGYYMVIVDASEGDFAIKRMSRLGATVFSQHRPGIGASRRQVFFYAREKVIQIGIPVIIWLEPEKYDLIQWIPRLIEPIEHGVADIVLMARTETSWQTYPAFQRVSEERINALYNSVMGRYAGSVPFDPAAGPVAFRSQFAKYFTRTDGRLLTPPVPDTYITHYAPMIAVCEGGARLASVPIDFKYPHRQRAIEEGPLAILMAKKRQRQMEDIMAGYRSIAAMYGLPTS